MKSSYSYLLIIIIGILLGGAAVWYGARPAIVSILGNQKKVAELQKNLEDAQEQLKVLKEFNRNPEAFAQTRDLILQALPQRAETALFAIRIEELSRDHEVHLANLAANQEKTKTKQPTENENTPGTKKGLQKEAGSAQSYPFSLSVSGSYEQLFSWLSSLEQLIPITEIKEVSLSQDQDQMNASLSGISYYLEPKKEQGALEFKISEAILDRLGKASAPGTPINLETETGFGKTNPFGSQ